MKMRENATDDLPSATWKSNMQAVHPIDYQSILTLFDRDRPLRVFIQPHAEKAPAPGQITSKLLAFIGSS